MVNNKCDSFVEQISESIRGGIYSTGERIPSERDLCDRFGLSRTTVRNGIAALAEKGLINHTKRGGVITSQARAILESPHAPDAATVWFIGDPGCMENPILQTVFNTIVSSIIPHYKPQVCLWSSDSRELPGEITGGQTVFLFGMRPEFQIRILEEITGKIVFINSRHPRCHWVSPDNYAGGRQLAEYLYDCGHRKISALFYGQPPQGAYDEFYERYQGARDFLWKKGIALNPLLTLERNGLSDFQLAQRGYQILRERERPSAILAQRDGIAMAIYELPASHRQRIPDELSIVGFDDIPSAAYLVPTLTTVRYPSEALAAAAVDILKRLDQGETGPLQISISPRLLVRQSVKKITMGL